MSIFTFVTNRTQLLIAFEKLYSDLQSMRTIRFAKWRHIRNHSLEKSSNKIKYFCFVFEYETQTSEAVLIDKVPMIIW